MVSTDGTDVVCMFVVVDAGTVAVLEGGGGWLKVVVVSCSSVLSTVIVVVGKWAAVLVGVVVGWGSLLLKMKGVVPSDGGVRRQLGSCNQAVVTRLISCSSAVIGGWSCW